MNRNQPRKAEAISADKIASVADELKKFVAVLSACEKVARERPDGTLAIYYWASVDATLKRVASFVRSADESRRQAVLGHPIEVNQLKPRSTAIKANESAPLEIVEHEISKTIESKKDKRNNRKKNS